MNGFLAGLLLVASAAVVPQPSGYEVMLTWSAPLHSVEPVAGYNVYRADSGVGDYEKLNSAPVSATAYTDTSVQFGGRYIYFVKSVDAQGHQSYPSNSWTATVPGRAAFELRTFRRPAVLLSTAVFLVIVLAALLFIRRRGSDSH